MQRNSRKRQAILNCLRGTQAHPTADWIFRRLKPDYPDLSLGTVYRNLNQLREAGAIRSMGVIAGQEHFDGNLAPHAHASCNRCGAIIDLEASPEYWGFVESIAASSGYAIAELQFSGLCPKCKACTGKEEGNGQ